LHRRINSIKNTEAIRRTGKNGQCCSSSHTFNKWGPQTAFLCFRNITSSCAAQTSQTLCLLIIFRLQHVTTAVYNLIPWDHTTQENNLELNPQPSPDSWFSAQH
jgi:hypothetical protein